MLIEIRHLRLVQAIVEEGTITQAGERLRLTQSALSCQLREIEQRLGTELFRRVGRRLVLTPAGDKVLDAARAIVPRLEAVEEEVRGGAGGARQPLRLSTECYTAYHWLPTLLTRMQTALPHVDIEIVTEATRDPIGALGSGLIDAAILTRPDRRNSRVLFHPIFRDEALIVMAPGHRLAARPHIDAEDLASEHVIMYDIPPEYSTLIQTVLKPAGVEPARLTRVPLTEAIIEMVRAGLGVAYLARWAAAPMLRARLLRGVRIGRNGLQREWGVATVRGHRVPTHVREFARLLAKEGAAYFGPEMKTLPIAING